MIFIGGEHILSSLGGSASENFNEAEKGNTGISFYQGDDIFSDKPIAVIKDFEIISGYSKIESICISSANSCLSKLKTEILNDNWLFILSTTKGDIDHLTGGDIEKAKPTYLLSRIAEKLPRKASTMVISNACISGLLAAITAHDLILAGKYDHILVVGVDVISNFINGGFESFYALSESPASPFDKDRTGFSLGEAVSSVVLSSKADIYLEQPMIFAGGASSNDANHISGPSRTGEGLLRAIESAFKTTAVDSSEIEFISAHGTGTRYNDDMESVAFSRANLANVPLNSFKGYFGHTLGAAGILELSMTIQSMRNGLMLKTRGCTIAETTETVNVLLRNKTSTLNTVLKTASGFGGCNAAAILKNITE